MTTEEKIKSDFVCHFKQSNWTLFKQGADYYLRKAATLKIGDVARSKLILPEVKKDGRLLFRNVQKRLFIGIACELIIKAYYLKNGFCINKLINKKGNVFYLEELNSSDVNPKDTITLSNLIQGLNKLEARCKREKSSSEIKTTLEIGKVFRNKEAHIITVGHKYDPSDYKIIEKGITKLYKEWFEEDLDFKISFEAGEKGKFELVRHIETK